MDFIKLFNTVKNEFDEETAILAIVAETIMLTKKVKLTDMTVKNTFSTRCNKKFKKITRDHNQGPIDIAINIPVAYHEFEICEAFNGLGGCELKTLKECIDTETKQ